MLAETDASRIPDEVLAEESAIALQSAYHALREKFLKRRETKGLSQKAIAARLGWNKALVSRRLHGRGNLTFRTLSELASAMGCRMVVQFVDYEDLPRANYRYGDNAIEEARTPTANVHWRVAGAGGAFNDTGTHAHAGPIIVRTNAELGC